MKFSVPAALLALLTLAAAVPLEKREEVTVFETVKFIKTVDMTTTIFVPPGDPRLLLQEHIQIPAAVPARVTPTPNLNFQHVNAVKHQGDQFKQDDHHQQAAHVAPPPSPPQQQEYHPPPPPPPPKVPANQPIVAKPENNPAPQSQPAPGPETQPGSGSCGQKGGMCNADHATTFDGAIGAAGTCGWMDNKFGEDYFALSFRLMGDEKTSYGPDQPANPFCGRHAKFIKDGQEFDGILTDKCPTCGDTGENVDLSPSLFKKIFGQDSGGYPLKWYFTDDPKQYSSP